MAIQNNPIAHGPHYLPLTGKNAIVTGGTRGIGLATAMHLASMGAEGVAVTYNHDEIAAQSARMKIEKLGAKVAVIQADVLSEDCADFVIDTALKTFGTNHVDIIVNNAAIAPDLPLSSITLEAFQKVFFANTFTPLAISRSALPHLPERGGRVINISSVLAKDPLGNEQRMVLAASKAALESVTRSMASVFAAQKQATFNSVCVGPTETETFKQIVSFMPQEVVQGMLRQHTAEHRFGQVEDIACVVGFLASEESRWINGASVPANGGFLVGVFG